MTSHKSNNIVFSQYYDSERGCDLWLTWSEVNKRTFFCCEPDCSNVAYESLGYRCSDCYNAVLLADAAAAEAEEHRCSGEFDYDLGHPICDFADAPDCPQYKPSTQPKDAPCPDCGKPFNVALAIAPDVCGSCALKRIHPCNRQTICADCGTERKDEEPELLCDWYCSPCWQTRFGKKADTGSAADQRQNSKAAHGALVVNRWSAHVAALTQCRHCHTRNTELRYEPLSDIYYLDCTACSGCHSVDKALLEDLPFIAETSCTDCGHTPADGHFPCYRGDDPLCAECEMNAYGPPEEEDWRERTGRCSSCDFFYDLHSSADRRDLCYNCQDDDDRSECPGCGCFIRGALCANGYCAVCWQEKFE